MTRTDNRRDDYLQFSLRGMLITGLVTGAVTGFWGPAIVRAIRQWCEPAAVAPLPPPVSPLAPWMRDRQTWDEQQTGYYESAETPLR